MYRPTMSSSFSTNLGSRETLKPRTRCGFRPLACQCRITVLALTPNSAAILRVLQCVAAAGLVCVVSSTSWATSTLAGGAPRGRSRSMPCKPRLGVTLAPTPDLHPSDCQALGDVLVLHALRSQQHDARALSQPDAVSLDRASLVNSSPAHPSTQSPGLLALAISNADNQ